MMNDEFLNQTQLGECFGASSHAIGRWLEDIGLRTGTHRPSDRAFNDGYVKAVPTGRGDPSGYYYVWHQRKTIAVLEAAGHARVDIPAPTSRLIGPFVLRRSSEDGFEIVGGDGIVSMWVRGEANAKVVAQILNLAHESGFLERVRQKAETPADAAVAPAQPTEH
jgi:hypothetical protein